jgi:hypothetical protein
LRANRNQAQAPASAQPSAQASGSNAAPAKKAEEQKSTAQPAATSSTSKSPFTSKAAEPQPNPRAQQFSNADAMGADDLIEEDIVQDHEDIELKPNSAREIDMIGASGNSASKSAMGIDQSIDTLNLDAYDHVEDIIITPRQ